MRGLLEQAIVADGGRRRASGQWGGGMSSGFIEGFYKGYVEQLEKRVNAAMNVPYLGDIIADRDGVARGKVTPGGAYAKGACFSKTKIRLLACSYCNTVHRKDCDTCPNCGAPRE